MALGNPASTQSLLGVYNVDQVPSLTFQAGSTISGATLVNPVMNEGINAGGATKTLTAANSGQTFKLDTAAGTVITLPAASGSGNTFGFVCTTTVTSNSHKILAASSSDSLQGNIITEDAGTCTGWNSAIATGNHSVAMNGSTTGGFQGDFLTFIDVAANVWQVNGFTKSTGTAATPFSTATS